MTSSNPDSSPPSLEELGVSGAASLLLPLILTIGSPREVAVFVHQPTGSVTIIEGFLDIQSVLYEIQLKQGQLPATKSSIDALPRVRVSEPGLECSICLSEYEVNGEAEVVNQMPCGHRFHAGCIGKWLGINGSCPVCRFSMPVDESKLSYESGGFGVNLIIIAGPDPDMEEADTDLDQETEETDTESETGLDQDMESGFGDVDENVENEMDFID